MGSDITLDKYLDMLDNILMLDKVNDTKTIKELLPYAFNLYRYEQQDRYSKPLLWIGMYIALASLFCILAMVADLLHGLKNRKFWFPCKYFTINAASLSIIAVAMKLPVDLSGSMPGDVDQVAKLGSMAFMCTMMANFLPSLASMNNKELFTNLIALGVLVITLVANVCIQIQTGVISYKEDAQLHERFIPESDLKQFGIYNKHLNTILATIYVTMLLVLLIIHICSSFAIVKSKQKIESKYQKVHDTVSKEQQSGGLTVEELEKRVSNYWIMAGTGSPQFITACSTTTSASGVICVLTTILHIVTIWWTITPLVNDNSVKGEYKSDYNWSMPAIFITQFIGVVIGTIAPLSRCFATLSFKVSIESIRKHINVLKVESYWTEQLSDWKQSSIPYPFRNRKCQAVIEKLKILILNVCIEFQEAIVKACNMISLIPFFFMICVFYCFRGLKWLKTKFGASRVVSGEKTEKLKNKYVLHFQDEMEFADRTLEGLAKSVERSIKKGEKKQSEDLMKLLKKSTDFEGVQNYDTVTDDHVSKKYQDCWSLSVVTLTTIAVSLPEFRNHKLLDTVNEGIVYVKHVEESLNATDDYVRIQKAAKRLWREVSVDHTWLENKLKDSASQGNTPGQIVKWFNDKAINNVESKVESTEICANSMYRITKTIQHSYHSNMEMVSQEELFEKLSSMISDILSACLTNLPQMIAMKCHTSAIEKREADVQGAAQLLGETEKIITTLQKRVPNMNPNDLPFIDKWRAYLKDSFP